MNFVALAYVIPPALKTLLNKKSLEFHCRNYFALTYINIHLQLLICKTKTFAYGTPSLKVSPNSLRSYQEHLFKFKFFILNQN